MHVAQSVLNARVGDGGAPLVRFTVTRGRTAHTSVIECSGLGYRVRELPFACAGDGAGALRELERALRGAEGALRRDGGGAQAVDLVPEHGVVRVRGAGAGFEAAVALVEATMSGGGW